MTRFDKVQPLGEKAVRVGFREKVSEETNRVLRAFCKVLEEEGHPGIVEWVPAYTSLTIYYRPHMMGYENMLDLIDELSLRVSDIELPPERVVTIPTFYGGERGPDLQSLAAYHSISQEEVIRIHSQRSYLVYMLGFAPGFPYLGGLSNKLHTPRLDKPRQGVPAGSVGIAGEQTGIYPLKSPGGWQLIGHTPVRLFDSRKEDPFLIRAGDRLRFKPIIEEEYKELCKRAENGEIVALYNSEEEEGFTYETPDRLK
ncbi:5-oxoprolinase subunit PxpB [Alteribacter populi]|uniref:5-oxoprolinase subunit PxpB n=1 Tax=Alteribacter populi TaxID=2011011 RepID=UPI0012FD0E7E|nr:5-oxoprolinase subunit PxpB [Alteribacter populi]